MNKKPVIYIAGPECFQPNGTELAQKAVELCEKYGNANNESIETVKTVISVIWTYCLILIALTALGVLFQKTWLMILSHVLGMLFVIVTGGFVFFMLTTACYIAASILFKKVNYEYKVYKAACALGK